MGPGFRRGDSFAPRNCSRKISNLGVEFHSGAGCEPAWERISMRLKLMLGAGAAALASLAVAAAAAPVVTAASAPAAATPGLGADPAVRSGSLPNGMRY